MQETSDEIFCILVVTDLMEINLSSENCHDNRPNLQTKKKNCLIFSTVKIITN